MTVLTPAGGYIDEDPLGDARSRHRMVEGRQKVAARDRVTERVAARSYNERGLAESCGLAEVNPPEQIARRLGRAIRYIPGDQLPDRTPTEGLIAEAVRRNPVETAPATPPEQLLEATIKTPDYVGARHVDAGAARAIGRIPVKDLNGRLVGYDTGSMISPC